MPPMEGQYPAAFFETTGMTSLLAFVILIQILSLAFLWLTAHQFKNILKRHANFFEAIADGKKHGGQETAPHVMYWLYIASTIIMIGITSTIFIFQPHLL
jgi:hypothetical protein